MATYFRKYYFTFVDHHEVAPATWRVDILDSQGAVPTEPFLLTPGGVPLIIERLETNDDKSKYIIGRQITFSYEYTGEPDIPLPTEFFEADERRFRVEVQKNGVLDGVYYIKPDFSEYEHKYPPFNVKLKATDGFGYAKAVPFDIYDDNDLLLYDKVSWYEAIMTRSLLQILDPGTKINVINSLYPNDIEPGVKLLFGCFAHTDIFFDFVSGAKSVHDVLTAFCKAFYARCFIAQNQVWFIRTQDLANTTFIAEQYVDAEVVNEVEIPGFLRTVGPSAAFDGLVVDQHGLIRMIPAIKKAEFEVEYKGINQLVNYDWSSWNGTAFEDWVSPNGAVISREGAGTISEPYKVFIHGFVTNVANEPYIVQINSNTTGNTFKIGDIVEAELRFEFHNTNIFQIAIVMTSLTPGTEPQALTQNGGWVNFFPNGVVDYSHRILSSRSGKKKEGSIKIKSLPIPQIVGDNLILSVYIFASNRLSYHTPAQPGDIIDGPGPDGIYLYPLKVSVIGTNSKGRHITITNQAQFSQQRSVEEFTFIDTGEEGVSNSTFTSVSLTPEDGGWATGKPGTTPGDIERQMAISHIDQNPRSVTSWEGSIYSNVLDFFNVIEFSSLPGKRFMQMSDNYNVKTCTHECLLMEVFPEGNASTDIIQYDIEEERD